MSATASHRAPSPPPGADFALASGEDARKDPVRLVVAQGDQRPPVDVADEPMVMTFPHLLVRELVAMLALSIGLVVIALFFDAPLEELANPEKTPNPAKAPWYFLGLQELLHYYPPLVSGVLLPGLVVFALAIVPYVEINLQRPSMWGGSGRARKLGWLWVVAGVLTALFWVTGAHPVWPVMGPLWAVAAAMSLPAVAPRSAWVARWISDRSVAFWVFLWFLLVASTLTVVGVFFRGPGWGFVLPWRDGIYY
jgi:hypothetical protein